jgi:hypothetical protein
MVTETSTKTTSTTKQLVPPYLSWVTFSGFLKSLNQGIPDPMDTSVMYSLNGSNRGLVMNALRYLKLIDENNHPTKDFQPLVDAMVKNDAEQKQTLLENQLKKAYPFLFGQGFDLKTSSANVFSQKFRDAGLSGETIRKGEAFFLEAAKEAKISISTYILGARKKGPKGGSSNTISKLRTKKMKKSVDGEEGQEQTEQEVDVRGIMLETLASKFPDFDPTWSPEAQAAWFEMYSRLLNLVQPETDAND